MELRDYLISKQSIANTNESFLLALLGGTLFGSVFGGLFGLLSKKQRDEYESSSSVIRNRSNEDDEILDEPKKSSKDDKDDKKSTDKNVISGIVSGDDLSKMSPEDQEEWILKTQFLMQKEIDKDSDSEESKRNVALMNQINACMYDEDGNLRSPEDREKFCKENLDPDATGDFIQAYTDASEKAAYKQPNDLNSLIGYDSITDEDIESQRNKSKESAKNTLTSLTKQKEENPDSDNYMNLMTACGYSEKDREEAKKKIDTKRANQKAEADKAEANAAFEQKKADITKDVTLTDEEKTNKIKEAETERDNKVKEIDDNLKKTIKDLGGEPQNTTTTTNGSGEPKTTGGGEGDSEEMKRLKDDKQKTLDDFEKFKSDTENDKDLSDEEKKTLIDDEKKKVDTKTKSFDEKIKAQKDYEDLVKSTQDDEKLSEEEKKSLIEDAKKERDEAFKKADGGKEPKEPKEPTKLSNEDIEKLQKEAGELDPDKDKDKIKEIENKLKQAAKDAGKDEDSYLIKTETDSNGTQYKKMTGPRGGKYYKAKPKDGSWSKDWISGEPGKNESFIDLSSYMKMIFG